MVTTNKYERRERRKKRIRRKVYGTSERPRLSVYRSLNNFYAQIVDDTQMRTIVSASSIDKDLKDKVASAASKSDVSKMVGELLARRAAAAGITRVVFDRNGYIYHGRVKAFAEAAREAGLQF
ncbi:MAG: 50S ribosomal protein L18 [Candidatus Kapabacteria bacterium]|nr:50S ribosomal protein L18 [Candidatus Kapabacteria bacterium]